MNTALFILAVSCIVMAGLLLHVAIRCNKLIDENRSFRATIRTLSTENESLKSKNLRKHVGMNCLARKSKQRGRTIQTLERKIGILNAQMLVTDGINAKLTPQVEGLKSTNSALQRTIVSHSKALQDVRGAIEKLKAENEALKQREQNCPFQRCRKNRIAYCMKEKK